MPLTYLHNTCPKMPPAKGLEVQVKATGAMSLVIGWHTIKIKVCPWCGKGGKQIVNEYFK